MKSKTDTFRQRAAPRTQREQKSLARRIQIIETALKLFARHGFDGTSTKTIAREVGVTEGLIFHYFPTKADILTAVLETQHSFAGDLRNLLENAANEPVEKMLQQIALGWLNRLRQEKGFTLILLSMAQTHSQVAQAWYTLIDTGISQLATYLQKRVEAGELRENLPAKTCAHAFFSALILFFMRYQSLPEAEWQTQKTVFVEEMISIWLAGAQA